MRGNKNSENDDGDFLRLGQSRDAETSRMQRR